MDRWTEGLVIGDDEILISQVNCMYEFPYGDLLVGTTESLQIFRDGKEISSSAHETGIESISGRGEYAVCIDGLGRAHIADSKGDLKQIQESSVLFAKVGPSIPIATESEMLAPTHMTEKTLGKANARRCGRKNNRNWLGSKYTGCRSRRPWFGTRR